LIVGYAPAAEPALVGGTAGLLWTLGGPPRVVFNITIALGKIVETDLIAHRERIGQFDLAILYD
jgi:hypothetical protein